MGVTIETAKNNLRNLERRDILASPLTGVQELSSILGYPGTFGSFHWNTGFRYMLLKNFA
jgi:hypothetical protein